VDTVVEEVMVLVWHIAVVVLWVSGPIMVIMLVESLLLLLNRLSALEMDCVSTAVSIALKNGAGECFLFFLDQVCAQRRERRGGGGGGEREELMKWKDEERVGR
jgi:hypothetical protein